MHKYEVLKLRMKSRQRYAFMLILIAGVVSGFAVYDIFIEVELGMQVFNYVLLVVAGFIFFFDLYVFVGVMLDLKDLKKDKLILVEAQFVSFTKLNQQKGVKQYTGQVFKEKETGKELYLDVIGVEPLKIYKIVYGKRSKLGIPVRN